MIGVMVWVINEVSLGVGMAFKGKRMRQRVDLAGLEGGLYVGA